MQVHSILDQAEIPTYQERHLTAEEILTRKRDAVIRGVHLTVAGRPVRLTPIGAGTLTHPPGQGGLRLTRVQLTRPARTRLDRPA